VKATLPVMLLTIPISLKVYGKIVPKGTRYPTAFTEVATLFMWVFLFLQIFI